MCFNRRQYLGANCGEVGREVSCISLNEPRSGIKLWHHCDLTLSRSVRLLTEIDRARPMTAIGSQTMMFYVNQEWCQSV